MANDVFVPQSTTTYSTLNAANAGEAGIDYGAPTEFVLDGTSAGADFAFSNADYASSIAIKAATGQETNGDSSVGAQTTTNTITSSVVGMTVDDIRSRRWNLDTGNFNCEFNNVVADGNGTLDVFGFRSAGTPAQNFTNCIAHNASEGWRATATNDNAIALNCTAVDCSGFGILRPRAVNCVSLETGSSAYLQVGATSSNYWGDDGTGSNAITEVPTTDIFADYAGGDYRIKDTSSPGAAGAGAFIYTVGGGGYTLDILTGTFSYSGGSIDLHLDRSVTPQTGVFSYTGTSLNLALGRYLDVQSGTFNYAGANLDLILDRVMTPQTGTFNYSGSSLDLLFNRSMDVQTGSFSYTGSSLELIYNQVGAYTLDILGGAFSYTGSEIDLLYNRVMGLTGGSFAYSGSSLGLSYNRSMDIETGAFSYNGGSTDLLFNRSIALGSGVFTYTGSPLNLAYSGVITLLIDSYSLQFNQNNVSIDYLN